LTIEIRFLKNKNFSEIHATSLEAFSDYAVNMSNVTDIILYNRAVKNGISFESSVAAFENDRMVGYTLVGIGPWKNTVSAFDITTGIIKPFRGQGITSRMFDSILEKLVSKGIHKFVLEVLQNNMPAIKAYEKIGFYIVREFDSFQLEFNKKKTFDKNNKDLQIRPVQRDQLSSFQDFLDWPPSWENNFAAIQRIPDEVVLLSAAYENRPVGLLAYYPALNWMMCLAVDKPMRRTGIAAGLLSSLIEIIKDKVPLVKLVNVLHTDDGTIEFLNRMGFEKYTSQYEMELEF
jgi:ribosomal protein S18 acetylase RimI-like enzyme